MKITQITKLKKRSLKFILADYNIRYRKRINRYLGHVHFDILNEFM